MTLAYYGGSDVTFDRLDIRNQPSLSVDLRAETGAVSVQDESREVPPGTFALSVCNRLDNGMPIGEIRIWLGDREVSIVGALTGRPGVVEVTPDHLQAALTNPQYRQQMLVWMGYHL